MKRSIPCHDDECVYKECWVCEGNECVKRDVVERMTDEETNDAAQKE
jgi:hypothetical protein